MKWHNFAQGTDEWHRVRALKLTASEAQAIAANGKGLDTYCFKVVTEYFSSNPDRYDNADMERGRELEPIARDIYELTTGNKVEQVGFGEYDKHTGCSPDGLVTEGKEKGGLEIKCLSDIRHMEVVLSNKYDKKYSWQCQMSLMLTGFPWWDLAFFNPNFEKSLIICRITPNEEEHKMLKEGIKKGKKLIKSYVKQYEQADNLR
jgi:predicted phage-related endonuclease